MSLIAMIVGLGSWLVLRKRPKSEEARPREKDGLRKSPLGRQVESARRLVLTLRCPGLLIGLLRESPARRTLKRAGQQFVDQSRHRHAAAFALMVEGADEKSGDGGLVAGRLCHQPHMPREWGRLRFYPFTAAKAEPGVQPSTLRRQRFLISWQTSSKRSMPTVSIRSATSERMSPG